MKTVLPVPALLLAGLAAAQDPVINEIRIDQTGTDNDEYFELSGVPDATLDGLTYVVIGDGTGGSGVVEDADDLTGLTLDANGFFVAAEGTFTLGTADLTTSLNFENADNVTHLLVRDWSGSSGMDLDTDDDGTLDLTPWTEIVDCVAILDDDAGGDLVYCGTTIGPDPGGDDMGHVFLCMAGWRIGPYDPLVGDDTPGAANDCASPPVGVTINELRIDMPGGGDEEEFFELLGDPSEPLDGLTYLVIGDGATASGTIEHVTDLTGNVVGVSGYFVVAQATFTIGTADLTVDLNFENSDNVTHLVVRDFTGLDGDDLDVDDDGTLDVTPWSEVVDCIALVADPLGGDLVYCNETVGPDGSFVPAHAFVCDDGWRIGNFDNFDKDTPGADNDCSFDPAFEIYCVSFPNSVSVDGAQIGWTGSGSVAANDTTLTVADVPDNFGLFLMAPQEDLVLPFGDGALCLGGRIDRLLPLTKAAGNANSRALDFTSAGPESQIVPGATWFFQFWYRDPGQGSESNVSNALQATFGS